MTKTFDKNGGSFMISRDVELDTDDMVEDKIETPQKTLKKINKNIEKLSKRKNLENFSNSSCLIHLERDEIEFSGTLESYRKFFGLCNHPSIKYETSLREIVFWGSYDTVVSITRNIKITRCYLEHIKGVKLLMFEEDVIIFDFNISEINGPLFKMHIKLGPAP